jgi:O-antigen ligase
MVFSPQNMKPIIDKIEINSLLKKGYYTFLFAILTVVILPIHVKYFPPFMILWIIFWMLENNFRFDIICNSKKAYKILFILFISYYIWQLAGIIYSSDIRMGFLNLFGRLSLVLFPLVLIYPGEMIKIKSKILIRIFAISTFIFMLVCFGYALYRSFNFQNGLWIFNTHPPEYFWLSYFYGSDLTMSHHPTYVAIYVLLSVFICFESWFDSSLRLLYRICWLIAGSLLLVTQYFLSSRAGILISLGLVPIYFILKYRELGKRRFSWLWVILVIVVLLPVIVKNQRVDYLLGGVLNKQTDYERKKDPRFLIWESSLKIAKKNLLLGVGIGDVRSELALEYGRIGEDKMANERLNAHNQFLEVLLENGIIGLAIFISIFISMFYIALTERNLLYGLFILMIFMFFLFETVLYRVAGVSFFSLFSFLLIYTNFAKENVKTLISKN